MSRRCELTAKAPQVGHKVSHSNIKTKRRFLPNLVNVTFISDALARNVRLRVSTNALKSVDHNGGLDAYLIKANADVLSGKVPYNPRETCHMAGVPDFDISSWQGYFGPAGMPKEIVTRLNAEIRKIVEKPEIKAQLATLGMDAFSGTPEQLGTFVNEQLVLWERLITNAKIEKQ